MDDDDQGYGPVDVAPEATGLKPAARTPRSPSQRSRAAATVVLPTPVFVPVMKIPGVI